MDEERVATWRQRVEQLARTEREKSAIGRAAASAKGQKFTLAWLTRQSGLGTDRTHQLLAHFLVRNGWVEGRGNTPGGRPLYVMTPVGEKCWRVYNNSLLDIIERGIDPVVEAQMRMAQMGIATEIEDERG